MEDERTSQSTESLLNKTFADKFFFIFELPEALKNLQPNQPGKNAKLGIEMK